MSPMDESALRGQLSNLETLRSSLHSWLHFWEWIVVVGLVIDLIVIVREFWDGWQNFKRGTIRSPERPSVLLLVLGLLGSGVVVIGISRELSVDSRMEAVETTIRGVNEELFGMVSEEASKAHQQAEAVSKETDDIHKRLITASAELTTIERAVRAQGPRWTVLANNANQFIRVLKPFSGSRITVLTCGRGVSPIEQLGTEQRLLNLLGKPGPNYTAANWETDYNRWGECADTSSNGLEMCISGSASASLKKAAEALRDDLLSLDIAASVHVVPPEQEHFWSASGADSPEARAARDPSTIFLLVAPSAMVEGAKPNTKTTKRHK